MNNQEPDPMWNDDPGAIPVSFKQIVGATAAIVIVVLACVMGWRILNPSADSAQAAPTPATSFR